MSFGGQNPQATTVTVFPTVRVGGDHLGLSDAAEPAHHRYASGRAQGQLVEIAQFRLATDEVWVELAQVAGNSIGTPRASNPVPQARSESFHPLAHVGTAQSSRTFGKERSKIHVVGPAHFLEPGREIGVIVAVVLLGDFDEVDWGDGFQTDERASLTAFELLELPTTIITAEV